MSSSSTSSHGQTPSSPADSTAGSTPRSDSAVRAAAVFTHGKEPLIVPAVQQLARVAAEAGVRLLYDTDEAAKHAVEHDPYAPADADLALVLGGDGSILRALQQFLGTGVPVFGINFGRFGFLTTAERDDLETALVRAFAGDFVVTDLPTLELELDGRVLPAVNDIVAASATLGRMVELGWAIGGEDLGVQPCDGLVCATPSGSTAYNLSNGGPVLVWGLEAMVLTFASPHSLFARPLVVPPGADLEVWNRTARVPVGVLVDGRNVGELAPDARAVVRFGRERSLLASLPETTFFTRYRQAFAQ